MTISELGIERMLELLGTDLKFIGIGTGAAPIEIDMQLPSEAERKATTNIQDGNTLICEAYWSESEANGIQYTNAGIFCGDSTASIGTGTLFSGDNIDIEKNNTQSLTISIEITAEAVNL